MEAVVAWALGLMLAWAPPGKSRIKDAIETAEEGAARYQSIARAAAEVAFDPDEAPLFKGPRARSGTLAVLLAVAWHESGFRRDVDLGLGKLARGTGANYSCLLQIRVGAGRTSEGWSHEDLVNDRHKCFRAGLTRMRRSFGACHKLDTRDWLGVYTSGECTANEPYSRARMGLALRAPKSPVDDEAALRDGG